MDENDPVFQAQMRIELNKAVEKARKAGLAENQIEQLLQQLKTQPKDRIEVEGQIGIARLTAARDAFRPQGPD